jgi:hypothetical protein
MRVAGAASFLERGASSLNQDEAVVGKRRAVFLAMGFAVLCLAACGGTGGTPTPGATAAPSPAQACDQPVTRASDKVAGADGTLLVFTAYLPPCYSRDLQASYPVLYWTAVGEQITFETAARLMRSDEVPPFILLVLDFAAAGSYGTDVQIVEYVVPYVDAHYRTRADRQHRSIAGISHGAAIAARSAFRAPGLFGRAGVISGGIVATEQDKFAGWIAATPQEEWPLILIDVGDKDPILPLTRDFMEVLDRQHVPYTFTQGPGSHDLAYWNGRMPDYLKWLVPLG